MRIIDSLPPELHIEVYKHLDGFSLRSLMWAFPELVADFMVVSDLPPDKELVPVFFKVPGIKITRVAEYNNIKRRRTLFTLYEFTDFDSEDSWFLDVMRKHPPTPYLEYDMSIVSSCFMYVRPLFFGICLGSTIEKFIQPAGSVTNMMIDPVTRDQMCTRIELRPSVRECGFPYWPTGTRHTVDSFYENSGLRLSLLRSLEVHSVSTISDLCFRKLDSLVVHFGSSTESGTYPSITNVTAPNLETFIVYYEDQFPVIRGFRPCENGLKHLPEPNPHFKAIHKPSITTHCCTSLPNCEVPKDEDDIDLAFTKRFDHIYIIGGPDELLKRVDLTNCLYLYWKQTSGNAQTQLECLDLRDTSQFTFETTLPRPKLPRLKTIRGLKFLSILWYYPLMDFNGLWQNVNFSRLRELGLWCYDSPINNNGSPSTHTRVPLSILEKSMWLLHVVMRGVELEKERPGDHVVLRELVRLDLARMKGTSGKAFDELSAARKVCPFII